MDIDGVKLMKEINETQQKFRNEFKQLCGKENYVFRADLEKHEVLKPYLASDKFKFFLRAVDGDDSQTITLPEFTRLFSAVDVYKQNFRDYPVCLFILADCNFSGKVQISEMEHMLESMKCDAKEIERITRYMRLGKTSSTEGCELQNFIEIYKVEVVKEAK